MGSSSEKPFRVIVVGGGVAGLTAAHALQRANIDYVVLEKGIIAPPMGAGIGIYPHGSRILKQIGCLEAVEDECYPLEKSIYSFLLPDGRILSKSNALGHCIRQYDTSRNVTSQEIGKLTKSVMVIPCQSWSGDAFLRFSMRNCRTNRKSAQIALWWTLSKMMIMSRLSSQTAESKKGTLS